MGNLIKMDLLKMRKIKITYVAFIVMTAYDLLLNIAGPILLKMIGDSTVREQFDQTVSFFSMVESPVMIMMMYFAVTAFSYMDIQHGYIKNIAGQLSNRGSVVYSKLAASAAYSLVFVIAAGLVNAFTSCVTFNVDFDFANLPLCLCTLLIKWLLAMSMISIFMFFTNGVKSNVAGYVMVMVFSTGATKAAYLGINFGLNKLDFLKDFDISVYMPDTLFDSVSVIKGEYVINAIVVGIVVFALFTFLTVSMFNKKDVK